MDYEHLRPKPPLIRRTRFWLSALIVVVLLAGGAIVFYTVHDAACDKAGLVEGRKHQCLGVSDGSFHFDPGLAGVADRIRLENARVDKLGKPAVFVAYLVPVPDADDPGAVDQIDGLRHELQGAYLAQRRANTTNERGDHPFIKMLIVNEGYRSSGWSQAVDKILARKGEFDRVVAVVGLGESTKDTERAAARLAEHKIPMFGAVITADNFGAGLPGLARVAATNTDQVKAGVAFLRGRSRKALLIQDRNPTDRYVQTLGDAFTKAYPAPGYEMIKRVEDYDSANDVGNTFVLMMSSICLQRPDVIYFAGRDNQLAMFLEALTQRSCSDLPIQIMTGDDAASLSRLIQRKRGQGKLDAASGLGVNTVVWYTALAHPAAWTGADSALFHQLTVQYFLGAVSGSCGDCFPSLFPDDTLDDGQAIMGHDAMWVAVQAIRITASTGTPRPKPEAVVQNMARLHGGEAVQCASGLVDLGADGYPVNKMVSILELKSDGSVKFVSVSRPG